MSIRQVSYAESEARAAAEVEDLRNGVGVPDLETSLALEAARNPKPVKITKEQIKSALPAQVRVSISDSLVDKINGIQQDPLVAENIRENFISYTSVLQEGRFKLESYFDAAAYITYKMMGYNNQEAYARTFPVRYAKLKADGKDSKTISAFVAAYNKNKLVNLVLEQTLIAPWILNQDIFQKAIYVQSDLMQNASNEKVRSDAAHSILTTLKAPEIKKVELDIGVRDSAGIDELKGSMKQLAEQQQELIRQGVSTKTIAHKELYEIEDAEEVEE